MATIEGAPAACHLCGLALGRAPVTESSHGDSLNFCCHGCANVYTILLESGMVRPGVSLRDTELFKRSLEMGLVAAGAAVGDASSPTALPADAPTVERLYRLTGLWCASCSWLIEHALRKERGVVSAEVLFVSDLLRIRYAPQYLPPARIAERLERLGYGMAEADRETDAARIETRNLLLRLGTAVFLWMNVMTFNLAIYAGYFEKTPDSIRHQLPWVLMTLATPAVFYAAWPILRLAWHGAREGVVRMESLLALGVLAAYGYSVVETVRGGDHLYFDTACAIVALVLVGKAVERNARARTSEAVTLLYSLVPKKARLLVPGGETFIAIDALQPGQIIVVKAGERVPADGIVVEGEAHVDESVLTGESKRVAKRPGSAVACGTVNGDAVLHIRATRVAAESTMAQIVQTVEAALTGRSAIERTADRVSRLFVPTIIAIALATVGGWLVVGHAPVGDALMHGITVLVIACPCALGIATPLALTAAVGAASRRGIFVADSRALEMLPRADVVILDKTGTVTDGDFALLEGDPDELARLAAVERFSEHPLGRAVTLAVAALARLPEATSIEVIRGQGIRGEVDGRLITIGQRGLMSGIPASIEARAREWERSGATVAFYGWDDQTRGLLAFGDRIRPDAADLVKRLRGWGIRVIVVSGDSAATTEWVTAQIGADQCHAEVPPEGKAAIVRSLQQQGLRVVMVGDGINDAPALVHADLGIALGSGTDVAMKAAAVVLVRHELSKVADTIELGRRTLRVVRQNLFWAFFYNTAGVTLAVAGILNPIVAAAGMVISSASVIANSHRLTRW